MSREDAQKLRNGRESMRRWGWRGVLSLYQQRPYVSLTYLGHDLHVRWWNPQKSFKEECSHIHIREKSHWLQDRRQTGKEWAGWVKGEPLLEAACGSLSSDFLASLLFPSLWTKEQKVQDQILFPPGLVGGQVTKLARALLLPLLNGLWSCSPCAGRPGLNPA